MAKNNNFLLNLKNATQYIYRFSSAKIQCKAAGCRVGRSCHLPFSGKANPTHRFAKTSPHQRNPVQIRTFLPADHFNNIRITP